MNGEVSMQSFQENMGGSKIVGKFEENSNIIKIEVKTLDSVAH